MMYMIDLFVYNEVSMIVIFIVRGVFVVVEIALASRRIPH